MTQTIRPRRSMLYVPGDKPRALEKAKTLACDAIIFDLEDAVAPENKARARDAIADAVHGGGYGAHELILRIGAADSPDDLALAGALPLNGVLLPKVESPATIAEVATRCPLPIWCMIETPLGVLRAAEIAAASNRLAGFVAGTNDLTKHLRARHTPARTPLLSALSLMVLAARACELAVIDGVHLDLDDPAGFEAVCRQGVELGFDGKSLVHPTTIDTANRIFGPVPDEITRARRMVAAWAQTRAQGLGVMRFDGMMVEQLHVEEANRLIALADAIARA